MFLLILLCYFGIVGVLAFAQTSSGPVIIANFNAPVDPSSATFMQRVVSQAKSQGASAIVIQMNTPGGLLTDMVSIISSINSVLP